MDAAAHVGNAIAVGTLAVIGAGFLGPAYIEQGGAAVVKMLAKGYVGSKVAPMLTSSGGSDGGFGTLASIGGGFVGAGFKVGGDATPSATAPKGPLAGVTDDEINAAVNATGNSNVMIKAPAPGGPTSAPSGAPTTNAALTGSRYNLNGNMMVNEHTVQSTSSAAGATGNAATRIRVHTADPSPNLSPTSNSASGNTVTIEQGSRRMTFDGRWHHVSTADDALLNDMHIPIHRP